jgi:branched-chain amino acid transport system permease protein
MRDFLTLFGFGVITAGSVMVPALGMTLMYGSSKFLNFAYGDMMTLAAFLTFACASLLPLPVAIVIAVAALAALGPFLQRILFAPLTNRGSLVLLVTSLGLSFILLNTIRAIWGTQSRSLDTPAYLNRGMSIGPFRLTPLQLTILAVALVITAALIIALYRTDLGIKIRAVAENPDLAMSSGVRVARLRSVTWAIASGLAGLGGVLIALTVAFSSGFGFSLLLTVAAAVIVGGVGSPVGAIVGSLVVGILSELSTQWIDPALKPGVAFIALAAVMLLRPQGLFGSVEA